MRVPKELVQQAIANPGKDMFDKIFECMVTRNIKTCTFSGTMNREKVREGYQELKRYTGSGCKVKFIGDFHLIKVINNNTI